jgi:hypothetical protein
MMIMMVVLSFLAFKKSQREEVNSAQCWWLDDLL